MLLNPDLYLQSITSKHLSATESKPNRIKTFTSSGLSKIVSYNQALDCCDSHIKALVDHATELNWLDKSDYAIGSTSSGYVLVLIPKVIND